MVGHPRFNQIITLSH